MKIEQMKFIDQKVGHLICIFLDIYEKLRKLLVKSDPPSHTLSDPKHILITKYFGMGSILLATPMIVALKKRYPKAKIIFLTFANNYDFLKLLNLTDEVLTLRTDSFASFTKDLLNRLIYLRKKHVDIAIDLEFFSKFSTLLAYMTGAKVRVGFYMRYLWRGNLLTHHIYYNHYKHISEIFLNFAQTLGANINNRKITLSIPDRGFESLDNCLIKHELTNNSPLVSINVNASELAIERKWPAEYFIALLNNLCTKFPEIKFVLIGSKKERDYVSNIYNRISPDINNVINLAGELSLEALLALLKRSLLFITNDSGPLHMAVALKTPTVSFFGPETPKLYGPRERIHTIFYADLYCSPCLSVYNVKTAMCGENNTCMKSINLEEVKSKVEKKLRQYVKG